jgi:hypothetical protein
MAIAKDLFTLKHDERFMIRLVHQIKQYQIRRLTCYFSMPKEMQVNADVLDVHQFYNANIVGKRAYISQMMDLPLVQSRFISRMKRDSSAYRVNLNVFVYHCLEAFERQTSELARHEDAEVFYIQLQETLKLLDDMLVRFRDTQPEDPKWNVYFQQADNYLSWSIEQKLLKLLSKAPKSAASFDSRQRVLEFCQTEHEYRHVQRYNSSMTMADPNRIANKMILLKRLIEQGVVFKEEEQELGRYLKKAVKGVATALVMIVVYALVLEAASMLSGLTFALVGTLALIYGFREIFKEDIRHVIWNYIQRGRPIFSRKLIDGMSKKLVALQKIWLSFMSHSDLPVQVESMLRRRLRQSSQDADFLFFQTDTQTYSEHFRKGYQGIQEQVIFNLAPFARHLERGQGSVFVQQSGNIAKNPIEKRYQVNLVVVLGPPEKPEIHALYKITMNRSGIVDIELAEEFFAETDAAEDKGSPTTAPSS